MKQRIEMQKFIKKIAIASIITSILGVLFMLPCFYILPYQTGDLGRLGGIPFGPYDTIFKVPDFLYTENIMDYESLKNVEILTIGDSFSQGDHLGYQNFLGRYLNKKVSNIAISGVTTINAATTLLENGMIPKCKVLIIESVERRLIDNLSKKNDFIDDITNHQLIHLQNHYFNPADTVILNYDFNFKHLTSFFKNKIGIFDKLKELQLTVPLFTAGKYSDRLFFYTAHTDRNNDLSYTNITNTQFQNSKAKLHVLKSLGKKHKIKIIILVAADKYDMYYDFIKDNPYSINPTFSYFSDFDTTFFINTKNILLPYIKNGEKDIYRVNDTHWSVKAAEIVGNHLGRIINESKN